MTLKAPLNCPTHGETTHTWMGIVEEHPMCDKCIAEWQLQINLMIAKAIMFGPTKD